MGFLEMLGVPYASCDVTASALGMDKYKMKAVLRQAELPVLDALLFTGREVATAGDAVLDKIEAALPYPVIVKMCIRDRVCTTYRTLPAASPPPWLSASRSRISSTPCGC